MEEKKKEILYWDLNTELEETELNMANIQLSSIF